MHYKDVVLGHFIRRENRFLAQVELAGQEVDVHVKNTSRLKELLLPGVAAALQKAGNSQRKTAYDLIAVEHQGRWVNIDSQAPNVVFGEWLKKGDYFGKITRLQPELRYGNSRFDYYFEADGRKFYAEVKGVTLLEEGVARFPGAPTLRGVKHMDELRACLAEGWEAVAAFIIARDDARALMPNDAMQPAFGEALRKAAAAGVQVLAIDCAVTADSLTARGFVKVIL